MPIFSCHCPTSPNNTSPSTPIKDCFNLTVSCLACLQPQQYSKEPWRHCSEDWEEFTSTRMIFWLLEVPQISTYRIWMRCWAASKMQDYASIVQSAHSWRLVLGACHWWKWTTPNRWPNSCFQASPYTQECHSTSLIPWSHQLLLEILAKSFHEAETPVQPPAKKQALDLDWTTWYGFQTRQRSSLSRLCSGTLWQYQTSTPGLRRIRVWYRFKNPQLCWASLLPTWERRVGYRLWCEKVSQ